MSDDQGNPGPQGSAGSQGSQGSGNPSDWVADLRLDEEQTRESIRKTGFKSGADLAKGYLALQGKLGSSVQPPKEGATEEEQAAFWKRLGRPEKPEEYTLDVPTLPEGMSVDEDFQKNLRLAAMKANLTKAQLKGIYDWYSQYTLGRYKTASEAQAKSRAEASEALKKELGDRFEKGLKLLPAYAAKFGGQKAIEAINKAGLGNHPDVVRFLLNQIFAFGEDKLEGGAGPAGNDTHVKGQLDYGTMRTVRKTTGA